MNRKFAFIAAAIGALAVMLGAFAAHRLKTALSPEFLTAFETGVRYQFYHVFALFGVAILQERSNNKWIRRSGNCFVAGIILFSGSLYWMTALRLMEARISEYPGMITPIGGLFLIAGWVFLLVALSRK